MYTLILHQGHFQIDDWPFIGQCKCVLVVVVFFGLLARICGIEQIIDEMRESRRAKKATSTKANIHPIAALCINKAERSDITTTDCGSLASFFSPPI